jgi:hypothetical protein
MLRMVAVLLLITFSSSLLGAQDHLFPAAPVDHPAGCHSHGPATPTPAPASYQCCANGHHTAIPNGAFSLPSFAEQICNVGSSDYPHLNAVAGFNPAVLVVPSSSPPGASPLRI